MARFIIGEGKSISTIKKQVNDDSVLYLDYERNQIPQEPFLPTDRILLLGENAALAAGVHIPPEELDLWRGSVVPVGEASGLITYNPTEIWKAHNSKTTKRGTFGTMQFSLQKDLKRFFDKANIIFDPYPHHSIDRYTLYPDDRLYFESIVDSLHPIKDNIVYALDIETKGSWVDIFSISSMPYVMLPGSNLHTIIIDTARIKDTEAEIAVEEFLASAVFVMHNGEFDVSVLENNEWAVRYPRYDTMIMHHNIYPDLPHDLGYLTSIYTNVPYYKWMLDESTETKDVHQRWRYCALDGYVTKRILSELMLFFGMGWKDAK